MDLYRAHVLVCGGTGCTSSGSNLLIERFEEQIAKHGLEKEVKVVRTGCFGLCEAGPVVIVYPEGTFYSRIKVEDVDTIVAEHLLGREYPLCDLQKSFYIQQALTRINSGGKAIHI